MPILTSKVTPAQQEQNEGGNEDVGQTSDIMFVILLHTLFRLFGGQRHPRLPSFETLMKERVLTEYTYVPPSSTIIYISHEWAGTDHPDPRGDQMYHLLLLLERLQRGDVGRTDMDAFHSLLYEHNYTTTAKDWENMLYPQKTFIFYDGFCVPKEKRGQAFRSKLLAK